MEAAIETRKTIQTAARKAWLKRNPNYFKEYMRGWRKKNAAHLLAYRAARRAKDRVAQRRRVKQVTGRICECCGCSDSERSWSTCIRRCAPCHVRGHRNGFCKVCKEALRVTVGRGIRPGTVACSCAEEAQVVKVTKHELLLWDALRWCDLLVLPLTTIAQTLKVSLRTIDRMSPKLIAVMRRFDPHAKRAQDKTASGAPRLVNGSAA